MDIIKDKMIDLLRNNISTKDIIVDIDFVTVSDNINDFINRTKEAVRVSGKSKYNEVNITLQIAIAIVYVIKERYAFIDNNSSIKQFIEKVNSAEVSSLSVSIYTLLNENNWSEEK